MGHCALFDEYDCSNGLDKMRRCLLIQFLRAKFGAERFLCSGGAGLIQESELYQLICRSRDRHCGKGESLRKGVIGIGLFPFRI